MIDSKSKNNIFVSCDSSDSWQEYFDLIINSIEQTKKLENIKNFYKFNVYLVGNEEIKKLNAEFLNNHYETDVLSFNFYEGWKEGVLLNENSLFPGEDSINDIGEIYISIPKIQSQSLENGISFSKELSTMAIHGALHLLGYNHEDILEEKIMFSKTDEILKNIILD